jgi:hypothetical protein
VPALCEYLSENQGIAHLGRTVCRGERELPAVLMAAEMLTLPAEYGGPIEFARMATLQAIIAMRSLCSIRRGEPPAAGTEG